MEPQKLIERALRLVRLGKSQSPKFFYDEIVKNRLISPYYKNYTGKDIVYLSFMCSQLSLGMKPEELMDLYNNLEKNLFYFSTLSVQGDVSIKTCDWCNGDGEVDCKECGGDGEIECYKCGGDGEVNGDECYKCGGDGTLSCPNCSFGTENCSQCDGSGEIEKEGYIPVYFGEYLSYDAEIFNTLEITEEYEKLPENFNLDSLDSELTFLFNSFETDVDTLESEPTEGDDYLEKMILRPILTRNNNGIVKVSI